MVELVEYLKNQKNRKKSNNDGLNSYARYSGMAFEMIAIILAATYGGIKLDELADSKPLFTAILSPLGVVAAIYIVIRDLLKKNN
jgi:ATP synthase protein I